MKLISPPRIDRAPHLSISLGENLGLYRKRSRSERLYAFVRLIWLTVAVHAGSFRCAPLEYLQALAWRARGLRVRSRNKIAALAGRSPRAYDLWMAQHEEAGIERISAESEIEPIYPVIDCTHGSDGLDATLKSVAAARCQVEPILLGVTDETRTSERKVVHDLAMLAERSPVWLLPMRAGDLLAPNSLVAYSEVVRRIDGVKIIYADDDLIDTSGVRRSPHFKPNWNPELFQHHDFITGASVVAADRQMLRELPRESWAEALVGSAIRRAGFPVHLAQLLHHRRQRPAPKIPAKPARTLERSQPRVSTIIPTRNRHDLLRNCLEGLERTSYSEVETIIVDNGSDERDTLDLLAMLNREGLTVLRLDGPFNYSALNNAAVKRATGKLLCFLNNDIEMIDSDWLDLLVQHAIKPDIGAVGARLLYPDGTVQHAGVYTGVGGGAGHAHRFQRAEDSGYFERARLPQRVSAVTGACLVVDRQKFNAVGGFDETQFPVAFNDVDLCLKLNSYGWQSFYEPRSTLIHHESKSRGKDSSKINRDRFARELAALKLKWRTDEVRDPYHHPHLSPFCEQFLVAI